VPSRRYLLAVLVYNGRDVVLPCLTSAARLLGPNVDVMVFDDCSPSPGWSEELADRCVQLSVGYYRSPRNLGIPRNMSLAMKTGVAMGYDVVGLVNSDVILPLNLCDSTDAVFDDAAAVGSVTPWSNNVSAFSLPLEGDLSLVADQAFVDQFSSGLFRDHGSEAMEIPTGVGYCMLLPTEAIRRVGFMDPIFGRGYCEEVDWCQRAAAAGFTNVLALGAYVYHEGGGTNRDEGLLAHGMTTVPEHELIISGRYPGYIANVREFLDRGDVARRGQEAVESVLRSMCRSRGYTLVISDIEVSGDNYGDTPVVRLNGQATMCAVHVGGLRAKFAVGRMWQPNILVNEFGLPAKVVVLEPGLFTEGWASWARTNSVSVAAVASYPGLV
jgi:GT2 family glycosyltransferase